MVKNIKWSLEIISRYVIVIQMSVIEKGLLAMLNYVHILGKSSHKEEN